MTHVSLIQCRNIVRRLCAKHRWQLLPEDEFVERIWARRQEVPEETDAQLQALAITIYCEAWYHACADGQRQEQGYREVLQFLYDHALYKCHDPEAASDIAQDAARRVYEQFAQCAKPKFFLNFLLFRLRHAETYHWRDQNRDKKNLALSLDETKDQDDEDVTNLLQIADADALSPEQNAVCKELRRQLVTLYTDLLQQRPRAADQLKAVLYKFHGECSDEEIASALGKNIDTIYTLRNRGLGVLREYPAIYALLKTIVETCIEVDHEV